MATIIKAGQLEAGHVVKVDDTCKRVERVYHPFGLPSMIAAELENDTRILQVPAWHVIEVMAED